MSSAKKDSYPLSLRQQLVVWGVVLMIVCLMVDNISGQVPFLSKIVEPVFARTTYLAGLRQSWDMFVYDQNDTFFMRTITLYSNKQPQITGAAYGDAPGWLITPDRTIDARLLAQDPTEQYKDAYLKYLCRTNEGAVMIDLQVAMLPLPAKPTDTVLDLRTQPRQYQTIMRHPC